MTRYFFLISCLLLSIVFNRPIASWAQTGADSTSTPDYAWGIPFNPALANERIFFGDSAHMAPRYDYFLNLFNKNVEVYNKMNDSLFIRSPKTEWIATYLRRARVTSQLNDWNQAAINYLLPRLHRDSIPQGLESLPYNSLINLGGFNDDFIQEEVLLNMHDVLSTVKSQGDKEMEAYLLDLFELAEIRHITSVSGDDRAFSQAYSLMRDIVDHYVPGRDIGDSKRTTDIFFRACQYLIEHREFVRKGVISVQQDHDLCHYVESLLADSIVSRNLQPALRKELTDIIHMNEFSLLRNVYMPDTTHRFDHVRDSLQLSFIELYDQHPEAEKLLSLSNLRRLAIMRFRSHKISALDALSVCELSRLTDTGGHISQLQFNNAISCLLDCIYCIDETTELTFEEKRLRVLSYCDEIYDLLSRIDFNNRMPNIVTTLSNVATYRRIHRYLVSDERKKLLETLIFLSQPFTRAHSETVSLLAVEILKGVISYQPKLLVGVRNYYTVEQLQKNPDRLINFFAEAARFHDVGKTRMPDIIRNDYRRLTDHEYDIIKLHPELGAEYLKVDPLLMDMYDIVVGHHRWYNGKGGYPMWFDNTKSEYRLLIDMLTLADCLEAATARLGRNYRKNKHFDDVMKEFRADAGTRYNPQLVKLIDEHPDVADKLRNITERGWEDVYYRVFNIRE